ncbi:dual specificity protein kinase kns1 [Quaeritorhiza haematococci]|nr:dual specificity protein kinase kns1 [Quaeritorhiza haematococci]
MDSMSRRGRKRGYDGNHYDPPPEPLRAPQRKQPIEVIVIDSESPPPKQHQQDPVFTASSGSSLTHPRGSSSYNAPNTNTLYATSSSSFNNQYTQYPNAPATTSSAAAGPSSSRYNKPAYVTSSGRSSRDSFKFTGGAGSRSSPVSNSRSHSYGSTSMPRHSSRKRPPPETYAPQNNSDVRSRPAPPSQQQPLPSSSSSYYPQGPRQKYVECIDLTTSPCTTSIIPNPSSSSSKRRKKDYHEGHGSSEHYQHHPSVNSVYNQHQQQSSSRPSGGSSHYTPSSSSYREKVFGLDWSVYGECGYELEGKRRLRGSLARVMYVVYGEKLYPTYWKIPLFLTVFRSPASERENIDEKNCVCSYTTPPTRRYPQQCDDKEGHLIVNPGDDITSRYKIMRLLGQGTFGKVVEALDRVKKQYVAIKIIRSIQKYRDASQVEMRVLNTLKQNDPENRKRCIHLRECFDFRNHICMVFELLAQSVFDFLKENQFNPFPMWQIQSFARQILEAVAFLHDLRLIHTDLKPENLMLERTESRYVPSKRNPGKKHRVLVDTSLRLIDFGSAIFEEDYHSSVVSTRHYRAPEIILGLGWSFPCDMWSIGCILVEFYTGDALFQTHDNLEHLAMMEAVLGRTPENMVRSLGPSAARYYRNGRLDYPNADTVKSSRRYVRAMRPLKDFIRPHDNLTTQFFDLVQKMLKYDPTERITAREALKHPFLSVPCPPESFRNA